MPFNHLLFRRQFLLTQENCEHLAHWQCICFSTFYLYAHPDIELTTIKNENSNLNIVLLGYMIDPSNPTLSNTDILNKIPKLLQSIDRITDYLYNIAGRFVLIINNAIDTYIFHDPCGLRSVYYSKQNNKINIGSQPHIFKYVIPLTPSKQSTTYNDSKYKASTLEHWVPSGCSLYENIHHLLPNHYLKLSSCEPIRYWPNKKLISRKANDVAEEASTLLKNLLMAANNRFPLALSLTAGFDSRILLSACKNIANSIYFYTLQYRNLTLKSPDIKIPQILLNRLGFAHSVIDCRIVPEPDFIQIYKENVSLAHDNDWGHIAYGMLNSYDSSKVAIKGNVSEICRCFYYKNGRHPLIKSPTQLLKYERMWEQIPFIREQISNWFKETKSVIETTGINLLDLFYWEHRMGSWQAQSQLEWDIIQEAYTPFNHRGLLEILLSTSTRYRCAPDYLLYKKICKILWPEVLKEPINPQFFIKKWLKDLKYKLKQ